MKENGLFSRRRFVGASLGVIGGVVVGPAVGRAGLGTDIGPYRGELPDGTQLLSGAIAAIASPSTVQLKGSGPGVITLQRQARVWKDGPARLTDFRPGDEVAAYGRWSDNGGGTFLADRLEPLYYPIEGTVISTDGDLLMTSSGATRFTRQTRRVLRDGQLTSVSPADFSAGEVVSVVGRKDAQETKLVAVRVYA